MPSFNYEFPYASRKLPIFADNVVATSQPRGVEHIGPRLGERLQPPDRVGKGGMAVD